MPNSNLHQNKSSRPNPTQAANDFLMKKVNDPGYQQKLFNNDFVNGVQNQVNHSKVLSQARKAGQPIKGLNGKTAIFPMGSM
jgi:hypothetical protein